MLYRTDVPKEHSLTKRVTYDTIHYGQAEQEDSREVLPNAEGQ